MELSDVVIEAIEFLSGVDFSTTQTEVSLFETTVSTRWMAGYMGWMLTMIG